MDKDQALEEMMGKLGDFGRYQCFQFILHIIAAMTAGMHMLSLVTVAAVPEHRIILGLLCRGNAFAYLLSKVMSERIHRVCWIDGVDTAGSVAKWNSTEILAAIPATVGGRLHNCYMYNKLNETEKCSKWVFNTKYRSSSRAIEWNFVCDNQWMGAIAQSVYMLGVLTGAAVLGGLADKYGRKTIFCSSGVLQLIFGVASAFIPEYWSFLVVQYFYAMFGSAGSFITGFVLTIEIVGVNKRTAYGVGFQCAFSLGIMLVAAWAALIDNRQILQVVYGLHGALLIPHIWIMDESPRWLWARGRAKEAVDIIQKGLKFNGSKEVLDITQILAKAKIHKQKNVDDSPNATILDLFRTPNLRIRTINVCFCWFANSLVYYGLFLSTGKMEGNPYLIIATLGLVEIPSYGVVIYFLDICGRRPLISSMMLFGGVACILAAHIQSESIMATVTVVLGKLFITASFAVIYNYSAELFPTILRNSALGLGSMCARFSGALTPFISLLDTFDPKIPTITFGVIALLSGLLTLLLPETMNQPIPQSIIEGEKFGNQDSCPMSCLKKKRSRRYSSQDKTNETMIPLEHQSENV